MRVAPMFAFALCFPLLLPAQANRPSTLRVCFDENNLPYSNNRGEGFENKIAAIVASDIGARLVPVWYGPRQKLVEHTLGEGRCDALMEVSPGTPEALTTRPYY